METKYLPQGEDIFSCTKCKLHFVLPSCCDHYQQAKIAELESQLTEKEALLKSAVEVLDSSLMFIDNGQNRSATYLIEEFLAKLKAGEE